MVFRPVLLLFVCFFKQKTAYEMRISDWSSDVCSSDLQQQAGVPAPTMNSIVGALRFFFTHTLDRPDLARKLIRTRQVRKIPVVLTMAEVKRLLDATRSLKHQAALSVAYGAGLRV